MRQPSDATDLARHSGRKQPLRTLATRLIFTHREHARAIGRLTDAHYQRTLGLVESAADIGCTSMAQAAEHGPAAKAGQQRRTKPVSRRTERHSQRADHKALVAVGYDAIGDAYVEWSARSTDPGRDRLAEFMARLSDGASVLDRGCGAGIPSTGLLAERFEITGLDISSRQLAAAQRNVPNATLVEADLTSVDFPAASFDGVTALYSISHVPRDEHAALFGRVARGLRPGGLFPASLGARDSAAWTGPWICGEPMFFSSFDAAVNRRLVMSAGFELLIDDVIDTIEPEGPVSFLWLLAQRPWRDAPTDSQS